MPYLEQVLREVLRVIPPVRGGFRIIKGKLQRSFTNKTNLTLIALQQSKLQVKVLENSMLIPLIFIVATIAVGIFKVPRFTRFRKSKF